MGPGEATVCFVTETMDDALRAKRIMLTLSDKEFRAHKRNPRGHYVHLTISYDDIYAICQALYEVIERAGGMKVVAAADAEQVDRILGRERPVERPLTGPGIYRPSRRSTS